MKKRNNVGRLTVILVALAWSVFQFYPLTGRNQIDVFQELAANKDADLTAIVERARKEPTSNQYQALLTAIATNDLTKYFPGIKATTPADHTRAVLNRVQQTASGKIKLGLDLQGGTSFLVGLDTTRMSTNDVNVDKKATLEQAIEVLRKRVDRFGVAEPILQPQGADRILIQLPGLSEAEIRAARETIQKAAFLEFRMVHPESEQLLAQGLSAPGYEKLIERRKDKSGRELTVPWLVKKGAEKGLTGKYVARAMVSRDPMSNTPQIALRFNDEGADLFGQITKSAVGRHFAIVLDGVLYSAPVIREPIMGGNASISGSYEIKEALELANVLENPLEAPVKILSETGVDPTLGKDTIRSGVWSAIYGTLAVAGFMVLYYFFAGFVADIALFTNIVLLLGVMCSVGTTLTLPGIAGVVLTIGMAVDANVLIFERIREELAKGKPLRAALSSGYDRAFTTIFDSHVTTLISSVILIYMGTGPIKGFGVTLTIGVAASLFTALVVTRLIFDFLIAKGWLKSLPMLHVIKSSALDFMKLAKPCFAISWVIIILGLAYGVFGRGQKMQGIDFAGGDNLTLRFAQKVEPDQLRDAIRKMGVAEPQIQYQKDATAKTETLRITSPFGTGREISGTLAKDFPDAHFEQAALENVGPIIGGEILRTAIIASLLSMLGILMYVAFRYEFSFAVSAVVAVFHDVLMTLAIYCATGLFGEGRQFNATMVAAVLTIIGFSLNDKVVIFDRIREDLKLGVRGNFREIINQALNQTLSRTIITSGTVFLATMSLFVFGGGAINDFAFTFLVGIITGTYSSIYIASALLLWWHKGQRPKTVSTPASMNAPITVKA